MTRKQETTKPLIETHNKKTIEFKTKHLRESLNTYIEKLLIQTLLVHVYFLKSLGELVTLGFEKPPKNVIPFPLCNCSYPWTLDVY